MSEIHPNTLDRVKRQDCEGGCEEHRGTVRLYRITWNDGKWTDHFAYCDEAVEVDRSREFNPVAVEVKP